MDIQVIVSLLSLIALEVVLGIDNVIFISILAGKLPESQQKKARQIGLVLAGIMRLGLLAIIAVIMRLDNELFSILGISISGKSLVLILGGLFLLYKSTKEIYHKMEGEADVVAAQAKANSFWQVIFQILLMDLVFSVDSIITAIGLVQEIWVMYVAIVITVIVMLFAAEFISSFVNKHPSFKMLALSFLLLIGFSLMGEGLGLHIPKGYIYFAMVFSLLVDIFQMRMNKKSTTVLPLDTGTTAKNG